LALRRSDNPGASAMNFTVSGLSPEPFRSLYGLSDAELAARRARRVVVDGAGLPERIEMRDAEPGETLLLVNFEHQPADSPYRSSHAVYVREGATETWSGDTLPAVMRKRLLSLRAFSADGSMVDADVVEGGEADPVIERLLGDPSVAYIHAHYAKPGCYAARIDRA
jgi:hypothetical protein